MSKAQGGKRICHTAIGRRRLPRSSGNCGAMTDVPRQHKPTCLATAVSPFCSLRRHGCHSVRGACHCGLFHCRRHQAGPQARPQGGAHHGGWHASCFKLGLKGGKVLGQGWRVSASCLMQQCVHRATCCTDRLSLATIACGAHPLCAGSCHQDRPDRVGARDAGQAVRGRQQPQAQPGLHPCEAGVAAGWRMVGWGTGSLRAAAALSEGR